MLFFLFIFLNPGSFDKTSMAEVISVDERTGLAVADISRCQVSCSILSNHFVVSLYWCQGQSTRFAFDCVPNMFKYSPFFLLAVQVCRVLCGGYSLDPSL